MLAPAAVSEEPRLDDPRMLDRLKQLVSMLHDERRRLATRLAEIEDELARLSSAVEAREPDLGDAGSSR